MKKAAITTLGCKVNQFESQAIGQELEKRGFTIVGFEEEADVYIVNSCTVTANSDHKSRQALHQAQKNHPQAITVLTGCYGQVEKHPEQLGADLVMGTGNRLKLVEEICRLIEQQPVEKTQRINVFQKGEMELLPAGSAEGRTRALLKIQDGCNQFCSYCIIPYARGALRSLSIENAVKEVKKLSDSGFKETVITGIEISSYGAENGKKESLIDLLEAICQAAPKMRLRLSSMDPTTITPDFCERAAVLKNLCPHFHLSLQSGCNETLKRMNRRYTAERFLESVDLLRSHFPNCAITTDLIAGFPGETDEEWHQTLDLIQKVQFSQMHIFPYSRRKGTPADRMPMQLTRKEKSCRVHEASLIADEMLQTYRKSMIGKTLYVLFETEDQEGSSGHSENYIPVTVRGTGLRGEVLPVLIKGLNGEHLQGEIQGPDRG